jgi:hypothetical protein
MTSKHFESIGWLGFILIISAYLFITLKLLDASSPIYHFLNLVGAMCMVTNAKHKDAKPLFWLNVVWSVIAIVGLISPLITRIIP